MMSFGRERMATSKRAQYQFEVKEGIDDPYIVAEHSGREPVSERPFNNSEGLWFQLKQGISYEEAERIRDFLNENLLYVAMTRFGDVEDIKRDVKHDTSRLRNTEETLRTVLGEIKASLRADDVTGALEHLKALEYQVNHLLYDWKRALQQYQWFI
jgi:hypothetical protein